MNILSPPRTDHYIHLFVERRADVTRALTPAAKIVATQAFRASLAELINEMTHSAPQACFECVRATAEDVGLTKGEIAQHTPGALEILEALDRNLRASATFPVALRKRAAS